MIPSHTQQFLISTRFHLVLLLLELLHCGQSVSGSIEKGGEETERKKDEFVLAGVSAQVDADTMNWFLECRFSHESHVEVIMRLSSYATSENDCLVHQTPSVLLASM